MTDKAHNEGAMAKLARSEALREICAVVFIFVLVAAMLSPLFNGDWPAGHDHPVHIFRIWQLEQNIRLHRTPWAWSNRWFTGCPTAVVYPVGADFLVLAARMVSLGRLTIPQAYGVTFGLSYFLYGWATYYFTRHAFASRAAGIIAAVLLLSDPGNNDIGGWFWIIDAGVWTAALGMVLALVGTVQLNALLQRPGAARAGAVGLCLGLGLLCHPLILIYFALAVALLCACRFVTGEATPWLTALIWLGLAFLCGLLVASFWLVPHLAARSYIAAIGAPGVSLEEIGTRIAAGMLFPRMWWLGLSFGFVGSLFLVLGARRSLALFIGSFVFLCIMLSSSSFVGLFGSSLKSWADQHMIFPRLLMLVKPFWFAAGAFLLVVSLQRIRRGVMDEEESRLVNGRHRRHRLIARSAAAIFLCGVLTPILFYSIKAYIRNEVLRPTRWHSQQPDLADRAAFVAWARAQPANEFFRICHGFAQDEHNLTDLGIDIPQPLYKNWDTPTGDHFIYDVNASSNAALRAVNVRYILAEHQLDRPDVVLERTFGRDLRLYRFRDWNPEPFVIEGSGEVRLEQFDDEQIVLRAMPGCNGLLRVNATYFPKWHATRDGQPLSITAVYLPDVEKSAFMQVQLLPGLYLFRYERDAADYLGTVFCFIGLVACLALISWDLVR